MTRTAHIDLKESALLVVDMQRYFLKPSAAAFLDPPPELVTNVLALVGHFRKIDRPVIFTRHANRKDRPQGQINRWWGDSLPFDGDPESELDDRIKRRSDETLITKETYSAFEGTALDSVLKKLSVRNLIICGVMTNVCVDTSARHAFLLGYQPVVVEDACAGKDRRLHEASLSCLAYAFAYTPKTHELFI